MKNIYFCRTCIHNLESNEKITKCRYCGSEDIVPLTENTIKITKRKIISNKLNDQFISFVVKDHKSAKAFEKILNFTKNKFRR